jgi:hypothetical protein
MDYWGDKMTKLTTTNPKFVARCTLSMFLVANWLYNTLIVGEEGIADFSSISNEVFNDNMFYVGAYKQVSRLLADLNDERILNEMMDSKTLLFNKKELKEIGSLDEEKMKLLLEDGVSIFDIMVTKKLAENTMFDENVMPTSYTVIDGSDKKATELTVPLSMVFAVDGDTLDGVSKLLDLDDTTIVSDTIKQLKLDDKLKCFKTTFDFIEKIEVL